MGVAIVTKHCSKVCFTAVKKLKWLHVGTTQRALKVLLPLLFADPDLIDLG